MSDKKLSCHLCGGEMKARTGRKHSKGFGLTLSLLGVFCILFWIGAILGIPLLLIGLYITFAKRDLWVCSGCHSAIERVEAGCC
ncbi:MAG: hypothetical protein HQL31_07885 [Planctomycetes bacterium]|nr:hypothetical protein [Planctomycetota bacterium]